MYASTVASEKEASRSAVNLSLTMGQTEQQEEHLILLSGKDGKSSLFDPKS